ncbi:uncharacterized protein LOC135398322 isoform X2 [Ornithodoros turicata]|uniref:uncharacterized protein LOC135398322 isoform X2 n=1 Tax=Ornithodoros turicata TaxID=34597 RepID=UPI0031395F5F
MSLRTLAGLHRVTVSHVQTLPLVCHQRLLSSSFIFDMVYIVESATNATTDLLLFAAISCKKDSLVIKDRCQWDTSTLLVLFITWNAFAACLHYVNACVEAVTLDIRLRKDVTALDPVASLNGTAYPNSTIAAPEEGVRLFAHLILFYTVLAIFKITILYFVYYKYLVFIRDDTYDVAYIPSSERSSRQDFGPPPWEWTTLASRPSSLAASSCQPPRRHRIKEVPEEIREESNLASSTSAQYSAANQWWQKRGDLDSSADFGSPLIAIPARMPSTFAVHGVSGQHTREDYASSFEALQQESFGSRRASKLGSDTDIRLKIIQESWSRRTMRDSSLGSEAATEKKEVLKKELFALPETLPGGSRIPSEAVDTTRPSIADQMSVKNKAKVKKKRLEETERFEYGM